MNRLIAVTMLFLPLFAGYAAAEESVKIKVVAINPSTTQNLKSSVVQYLPPEVDAEDVLDKEGIEILYDAERKAYYIKKEVELEPSETKTIEVRVKNVWIIDSEKIEEVKSQLKASVDALSATKFAETGKLLFERANEVLQQIEENQLKQIGIMQRIELYRFNMRQLEDLQQNAISLEAMRRLEAEDKQGVREVKFFVTAENPANEEKNLIVRSELPREIEAKDVLDKGDFRLSFDSSSLRFVLEKEDTLGPRESKKYQITLRDVWYIPQEEIDFLKSETEKITQLFVDSPYEEFASKQSEVIVKNLASINLLQSEVASSTVIEERVRAYILNEQRLQFVKRKMKELQDLLSEITLKPKKKDIADQIKQLVKKIADIKNLVVMAMGFDPEKSIIWIIFLGIVGFLAFVTVIFYAVWLLKLQDNKWTQKKGKDAPKNTDEPEKPKT